MLFMTIFFDNLVLEIVLGVCNVIVDNLQSNQCVRHSWNINLLDKINNIDEDCSEDDQEVYGIDDDTAENYCDLFDSETDEDKILNICRGQERKTFIVSSESANEEEIETAMNGTVWKKIKEGSNSGRTSICNIFEEISGPTGYAKRNIMKGRAFSAFSLIIDHIMIEHVREYTESEAFRVLKTKWNLSIAKLYAFIGLLYARGSYEAKNINLSYLWNKKWGPSFFSTTMGRNDFAEIMRFIRFDNKNQRSQRLQNDKFALISQVWYKFIENSQNCYKPGAYLTIDEQLFPTKARCIFTQYMPNKPDKFGIKLWLASDVTSKYIVNGFPHLGKVEGRESSIPLEEFVTLKLAEPYTGHGRNITFDNFFTSASLASKLLTKRTTLVGTIRRNKRELPKLARQAKDSMTRFSTILHKSKDFILTIYKAKPNKKVLILSSMHASVEIEKIDTRILETIRVYNSTKFGVDVTHQMARKYSVKSKCQRWILYKETTGEEMSRQEFLFQLAEELGTEYQKEKQISQECSSKTTINTNTASSERRSCQIKYCKVNKTKFV
ncbi:piggyBac transposable element-derived protein 4-like isoform 1-T2 [Glossina fuscipes fuscipes]